MGADTVVTRTEHGARTHTLVNVQGLRGLAALVVVVAHVSGTDGFESRVFGSSWAGWANLPSNTGVDLFFVISGLIMVVTTWKAFDDRGSVGVFLYRRVTRIYPLYWLVNTALLLGVVALPAVATFTQGHANLVASYLLLPHEGRLPVLVAWTLVFEMYFYLVFSLVLAFKRRRVLWVGGAWVVFTLVAHLVFSGTTNPYLAVVSSLLSLEFVMGAAIGLMVVHRRLTGGRVALVAGLVLLAADWVMLSASGWDFFPSDTVRVLGSGVPAALIVYGAVSLEVVGQRLVPGPLRQLGDASYSLYLLHVPALTLLAAILAGRLPTNPATHAVFLVVPFVYVVVAALVCHRVLEKPIHRFFTGLLRRRRAAT